jgi:uncharacterized protein YaaW (UPF0174 family)
MENKDLRFLSGADNDDLRVLIDYLTKDKKGNERVTESLTYTDEYKKNYPNNLCLMADSIGDELRRFGSNTLATMFRGEGVEYKEVLTDVCHKLKVNFNKKSRVEVIELNLLQKIFESSLDNMSDSDLETVMKEINPNHFKGAMKYSKQAMIAAIQIAIKQGGFASYKIAMIVANATAKALLGRGLSLAVNAGLTRWMSILAGPIGWTITALWTAIDIAGPAYRVTIPAIIQVAYMRTKMKSTEPKIIEKFNNKYESIKPIESIIAKWDNQQNSVKSNVDRISEKF